MDILLPRSIVDLKDRANSEEAIPDSTHPEKLSRSRKLVLQAFVLLQAVHSLLFVIISTTRFVSQDLFSGISGWQLERLVAALISLILVVLILRETIFDKRREWALILILAIDVVCYGFWAWTREALETKIMLAAQLALTPFVIAVLFKTVRRCGVTLADLFAAAGAIVIAAVVFFVRGTYFPVISTNWSPAPPLYYRLLTYSDFHWPQEKSLALLMLSFLAVAWIFDKITGRRIGVADKQKKPSL
jgi:hypothetical protein